MVFSDFVRLFTKVYLCRVFPDEEYRQYCIHGEHKLNNVSLILVLVCSLANRSNSVGVLTVTRVRTGSIVGCTIHCGVDNTSLFLSWRASSQESGRERQLAGRQSQ